MRDLLLISGGLLTVFAIVPYLRDIYRGKTKPRIASWVVWTVLTGIGAVAAWVAGEPRTAIFSACATLGTFFVIMFSVKNGDHLFDKFDISCLIGACVGLILWALFDSPTLAIVSVVIIDFLGALPTIKHAWQKPFEETWQTFAICSVGAGLVLLSLDSFTVAALAYPIYIVSANIILSSIILSRRRLRQTHSTT